MDAIVIGAGPAGLATAAAMRKRGVDALVIESGEAVGTRWRTRYEGLRLNTIRVMSGLPGHGMPRSFGRYASRDDFVTYLDNYAKYHQLAIRFNSIVQNVNRATTGWVVRTATEELAATHLVIATGYQAVPHVPDWPGKDAYEGQLIHAAHHRSNDIYQGKKVLVVGTGVTGIDIAGLLIKAGAHVTVSMRTAPNIFPRDWLGFPLQLGGFFSSSGPAIVGDIAGFAMQWLIFGNLSRYGMPRSTAGIETHYRQTLEYASVDDGFIDALKKRRTKIVAPVHHFNKSEVVLDDDTRLKPDLVLCATGYRRGLEPIVGHLGVLDAKGLPSNYKSGIVGDIANGMYFCGFWPSNIGHLWQIGVQARHIAKVASGAGR